MSKGAQYLCCDVNSRISADVIILLKESNTFMQLQKCYDTYEEQQKTLLKELNKKLEVLHVKKSETLPCNTPLISSKISEFEQLVIQVCDIGKEQLMNRSSKLKYLTKEGLPIIAYIHKLTAFTEHIYSNYYQGFVHPQCSSAFFQLSNQLSNVLYPELSHADIFEQNLAYLKCHIQFLGLVHSMVDQYISSMKTDISSFYKDFIKEYIYPVETKINKDLLPSMVLCSLLKGDILLEEAVVNTTPVVEDSITKFFNVMTNCVQYLLDRTPVQARIKCIPSSATYKGCLDAPYSNTLTLSTNYMPSRGHTAGIRGRGRTQRGAFTSRMLAHRLDKNEKVDLVPIRVPSLVKTHLLPIE